MEKRSRRRIRDLVALAAFQGLSQNEIGCARISMMARSTKAPFKGRIQKRKTNHLQIITFGLQRTAGPYKGANRDLIAANVTSRDVSHSLTLPNASERYTLHASRLQSETVQLNRGDARLGRQRRAAQHHSGPNTSRRCDVCTGHHYLSRDTGSREPRMPLDRSGAPQYFDLGLPWIKK
jgi:hypothetical protein